MTSSEHSPWTGISSTKPSVRAVTRPTRSPVNGPGTDADRDPR